jgi:hypothetical protein
VAGTVDVDAKMFRKVRISDLATDAEETLALLSTLFRPRRRGEGLRGRSKQS